MDREKRRIFFVGYLALTLASVLPCTSTPLASSHLMYSPLPLTLIMSAVPSNPSMVRLVTNKKCPFAQKVWIALEEYYGSNNYELMEVSLYGGNGKPKWFMDINPKGQVPVLWLPSGRIITESDAILDYLVTLPDLKSGRNPLAPPSVNAWTKWRGLMNPFLASAKASINRGDTAGLSTLLYNLERQCPAPSPFLGGQEFSAVDASVLPFIQRLVEDDDALVRESAPKIYQWYLQMEERRSFKATRIKGWWWWW